MLTACALALLLVASAPSTEAPVDHDTPVRCDDERASCRDGCSMDYGTSITTRDKIGTCLDQCDERRDVCLLRVVAKQKLKPPAPARKEVEEPVKRAEPQQPSAPYTLPPTEYSKTPVRAEDTQEELPPAHRTATPVGHENDQPDPAPLTSSPARAGSPSAAPEAKPARSPKKKKARPQSDANAP
jgi:hypothetical protein